MHNVERMPDQTTSAVRAPAENRTREGRRLDLDVVRGLAIVLALGWHFSGERSGNPVLDALTAPGRSFGWAGVDLFFVLSGFLLGRLVLTEQARTGRFDGWRFTIRRVLKLWPVLYVFLALEVLFPLFARRRGSPRVLATVLVGILVAALALRIWGVAHGLSDVR